jgi:hypothetical protein
MVTGSALAGRVDPSLDQGRRRWLSRFGPEEWGLGLRDSVLAQIRHGNSGNREAPPAFCSLSKKFFRWCGRVNAGFRQKDILAAVWGAVRTFSSIVSLQKGLLSQA